MNTLRQARGVLCFSISHWEILASQVVGVRLRLYCILSNLGCTLENFPPGKFSRVRWLTYNLS